MTTHRRRPSGSARPGRFPGAPQRHSSNTDPVHLISGYATETLSQDEQRHLYRAALDDQEVFDRLVEEESWRQIFEAPGVRDELLQALTETPAANVTPEVRRRTSPAGTRSWLGVLRGSKRGSRRYVPPMVMGTAAAALLAIALIPRWIELGMTGPVEETAPRAAATPSTELTPKGYGARQSTGTETPVNDFVAKSFDSSKSDGADVPLQPKSSTRGLQSKSPDGILNISYALELNQPGGTREVPDSWVFRAGDQFRLKLGIDFDAWLYLFNRATGDAVYTLLYPRDSSEHVPLRSSQDVILPADTWLTMDATPEDEQLVLVVSAKSWAFAAGRKTIPASELDAALAEVEARFASLHWRRSEVGERVRLSVEDAESLAVVIRLLDG